MSDNNETHLVAVCPDCGNEVPEAGWTCGECSDDDDPDGWANDEDDDEDTTTADS